MHSASRPPTAKVSTVKTARSVNAPTSRLSQRLLAGALALTTLWAGGATYYLVFHDEVLARFVSQQSAIQYTYEERIGALRIQLDRTTMEQAVARDGIAQRLAEIARRQAAMETRQAQLATLTGEAGAAPQAPSPTTPPWARRPRG